jgi:hypothetical protein
MTKYEATPEQWGALYEDAFDCDAISACLFVLRSRIEALETKYETQRLATLEWGKDVDKVKRWSDRHLQRIEALEANVTCPHVATSDEGTSYCTLAEQAAKPSSDSLVERVRRAIVEHGDGETYRDEARAAIYEMAAWLDTKGQHGCSLWLREEAER